MKRIFSIVLILETVETVFLVPAIGLDIMCLVHLIWGMNNIVGLCIYQK